MLSDKESDLLTELTEQLKQQYQCLDRIVDSMDVHSEPTNEGISEQLKAIKQTESLLVPLREEFRRSGRQLPAHLQQATDETIELIKGLMPKLAQLEKATLESAKRLFPKIQQSVRAVQMRDAYRTAGSTVN